MTSDPWQVRDAGDGLTLELHGGDKPALVLRQGGQAIRVELTHVKALVAALVDGATDLAEVLGDEAGDIVPDDIRHAPVTGCNSTGGRRKGERKSALRNELVYCSAVDGGNLTGQHAVVSG